MNKLSSITIFIIQKIRCLPGEIYIKENALNILKENALKIGFSKKYSSKFLSLNLFLAILIIQRKYSIYVYGTTWIAFNVKEAQLPFAFIIFVYACELEFPVFGIPLKFLLKCVKYVQ